MKDLTNVEMRINGQETTVIDGIMELRMEVVVRFMMPAQNNRLPAMVEDALEEVGQQFKRRTYEQAMEGADEELLKERMNTGELLRRGKKLYTFKTKFGEAKVKRHRVSTRNGRTEIPSHHAWGTPRQVCITPGLRAVVCDLVVKESVSSTLAEIEKRTANPGILSSRSCLNILPEEGAALTRAPGNEPEQYLKQYQQQKI